MTSHRGHAQLPPFARLRAMLLVAFSCLCIAVPAVAVDEYSDMLGRVPDTANVLLLADIETILRSELGLREEWAGLSQQAQARCMIFPVDAKRMIVAARLDFRSLDYEWKIGLAEAHGNLPTLSSVADRERGQIEQVAGTAVVWTPRDLFVVEFPPRAIGFFSPADRQALARWLRSMAARPKAVLSAFAERAVSHVGREAPLVLAIDLSDTVSTNQALERLKSLEAVKQKPLDAAALAPLLATIRGGYLTLDVQDAIRGTLRIEFEQPVEALEPIARDLVIAALEDSGAEIPDVTRWKTRIEGKVIVLSGELSRESARRVMSLVRPLHFDASEIPKPFPTGSQRVPPATTGEATRAYYRAVIDLLDGLKPEKGKSLNFQAIWYDRYARNIDDLPLLNVDPDMLVFGSRVSRTLREIALGIRHSASMRRHRKAESMNLDTYHAALIDRQEDAHLADFVSERREAIRVAAADFRKAMVERYKVEF